MTARAPVGNHPDVFLGDLKTRTVTTLLTDAEWPSLAYPFVYATTFTNFADLRTRTFIRHDISTNEETALPLPPSRNFCFTSTFGLVVTLDNRAMLVDPAGNELTASQSLAASGSAPFFQPSCGDRQIVWNNPVSSWLLDGTTMKLIELARRANANLAESAGGWVRWTEDATPSPATVDTFSAKFRFALVDDIVPR